jgi:hypothetical protein
MMTQKKKRKKWVCKMQTGIHHTPVGNDRAVSLQTISRPRGVFHIRLNVRDVLEIKRGGGCIEEMRNVHRQGGNGGVKTY